VIDLRVFDRLAAYPTNQFTTYPQKLPFANPMSYLPHIVALTVICYCASLVHSQETGLTKSSADEAIEQVWQRRSAELQMALTEELSNEKIQAAGQSMQLLVKQFGTAPASGASLYISMHGGGGAPARVNDQQWRNQSGLYEPDEGFYVAPRAPTNNWNLWHEAHIDALMDRLIMAFVICKGVDPDRVYIMGYSAGGDGVFQVAPRMSDRFAAAAMMAGHPNETKPEGLRNLPFALFMGGKDSAYNRNTIAEQWKVQLAKLAEQDRQGYPHFVQIYPDLPHWMNRKDREALPWMKEKARDCWPKKIVWLQDDVTHDRLYWLGVPQGQAKERTLIVATASDQTINIQTDVAAVNLFLSDRLLDLDKPISVTWNDEVVFAGKVERSLKSIETSLEQRFDKQLAAPVILQFNRKNS
jgi:predicted esterase